MSGFGPRTERENKDIKRRAEVRSTAELGAVSAKASPPRPEVSCAVYDGHNNDVFHAHPVYDSVIADEQFSVLVTPEFRKPPATIRQRRERLRRFQ